MREKCETGRTLRENSEKHESPGKIGRVDKYEQYVSEWLVFSFYLPPSQVPHKKIDIILSTVRVVTRKMGRAHPPLISLAQILVVNEKC